MNGNDGGEYVLLHLGLLDDQRFIDMDHRLVRPWVILELCLRREHPIGKFADHARVIWLIRRLGGYTQEEALELHGGLVDAGWLIEDAHYVTLRGWGKFAYRPERPTTRAGRAEAGEAHAATLVPAVPHGAAPVRGVTHRAEKRGEEKRGENDVISSRNDGVIQAELEQKARAVAGSRRPRGQLTPMGEAMRAAGLHPSLLGEDDAER